MCMYQEQARTIYKSAKTRGHLMAVRCMYCTVRLSTLFHYPLFQSWPFNIVKFFNYRPVLVLMDKSDFHLLRKHIICVSWLVSPNNCRRHNVFTTRFITWEFQVHSITDLVQQLYTAGRFYVRAKSLARSVHKHRVILTCTDIVILTCTDIYLEMMVV